MSLTVTPLPPRLQRCNNCLFWRAWAVQPAHDPDKHVATFGDCRRHAPGCFQPGMESLPRTKFPSTAQHDFCGDYQAAIQGEPRTQP